MTYSPKQRAILGHLHNNPQITLDEAVTLIGGNIYTNERFHVGNVLSNMVKRRMIVREKPGVFRMPAPNDLLDWERKHREQN